MWIAEFYLYQKSSLVMRNLSELGRGGGGGKKGKKKNWEKNKEKLKMVKGWGIKEYLIKKI